MTTFRQLPRIGFSAGVVALMLSCAAPAPAATVAYWRFEEGPDGARVSKGGTGDGVFYAGVADSSGNGNALSAWTEADWGGYKYTTDLPGAFIPRTGAANNFSVVNTGGYPGMFTASDTLRTLTPSAWTIEASFKPENGGYRTLIGRDSLGAFSGNQDLSALYLQMIPGDALAIKFTDVSGVWHEAISAPGAIKGYQYPDAASGFWYNVAAVSDGSILSLYLNSGAGYSLIAQTDMTGSSANTALTAGMGDGGDWDAGNWSVGRGLYAGGHVDRAYGFIDEVRISDGALSPDQFLFAVPEPGAFSFAIIGGLTLLFRRRRGSC